MIICHYWGKLGAIYYILADSRDRKGAIITDI